MSSISSVYMPRAIFYGSDSFKLLGVETRKLGTRALIISDRVMEADVQLSAKSGATVTKSTVPPFSNKLMMHCI
jgi:hypothetical protein